MNIYVDMLFAINFSMDFLALFLTASLMRRRLHKKRSLISASIGGLYGVVDVVLRLNSVISLIIGVLISFLMCFITFYEKNIKRFAVMYISYWGISACLGGFMSIFYSFLNRILSKYIAEHSQGVVYSNARFLIILFLAVIVSTLFARSFGKERKIKNAKLNIELNGKSFELYGLVDSGNLLTEPISGKSVILVSDNSPIGKEILNMSDLKKRFIPYTAVGAEGLLKGVTPKLLKINDAEVAAIIAPICKKDFAGYESCVPLALI